MTYQYDNATQHPVVRRFSVHSLLDFVVLAYVLNFSRRTDNNGKSQDYLQVTANTHYNITTCTEQD